MGTACKDETRFQGIATPGDPGIAPPLAGRRLARTRPVFRGLRLVCLGEVEHLLHFSPCRDETRFQGIATLTMCSHGASTSRPLARTRPVFRGLRRPGIYASSFLLPDRASQGRDPFSGDCDRPNRTLITSERTNLQGRDPFSGDCDVTRRMTGSVKAVSALEGRDPFSGDCDLS